MNKNTKAENTGLPVYEKKALSVSKDGSSVLKKVGQSNHESYYLPEEVREHVDEPMYILLGIWCFKQSGWVDRDSVAEAFYISTRRASGLLRYMSQRIPHKIRTVTDNANKVTGKSYEYCVESIDWLQERKNMLKRTTTAHREGKKRGPTRNRIGNGRQDLWRWVHAQIRGKAS